MVLIPGLGRSHLPQSNRACAPQLLSLCSRAQDLQLLKPLGPRTHDLQQEKPPTKRSLCPTTKSRPHLLQLEKAHAQQWRSSAAKNKKIKYKKKKKKKKDSVCTCSTLFSWTTSSSQSVLWAECHKITTWSTPALFLYQPGDSPENVSWAPESSRIMLVLKMFSWTDEEEGYITLAQDSFA